MVTGAERWLMRRFDVVSTISQHMHQRLLDKGVAPERAVLAPNWVDISAITPGGGNGDMDCRASLAMTKVGAMTGSFREVLEIPPDAVVALYSGNMGAKQGLELLADLARLCLEDSASNTPLEHKQRAKAAIIFVFCGSGAGRTELVVRCAGLPNVHFLDLQPIERLNELLAMADIHLLPQRADAADLVMPSKLTGMLASGRPVVATALPATELGRVVAGEGCGLVVPPGDAQAFADALQTLASSPEVRKQMGRAGRSYAETHLDRDAILQQLEARLMHGRRSTFKNAS
jgi:colanic acid biosynthesis glycosyl transferase WcaI